MIKIKPIYWVSFGPNVVYVKSEVKQLSYPASFKKLFVKLLERNLSLSKLPDDEIDALHQLSDDGIIHESEGELSSFAGFFELYGWSEGYVQQQLDHHRVAVVNYHPNPFYSQAILDNLSRFGFDVSRFQSDISPPPTLVINVIEKLNQKVLDVYPALNVKIGSYIPMIGPLLSFKLTPAEHRRRVEFNMAYFEETSFNEPQLSYYFKQLSVGLLTQELLLFLVMGAARDISHSLVKWHLNGPSREVITP